MDMSVYWKVGAFGSRDDFLRLMRSFSAIVHTFVKLADFVGI